MIGQSSGQQRKKSKSKGSKVTHVTTRRVTRGMTTDRYIAYIGTPLGAMWHTVHMTR
jgi:hypothetical protein